MKEKIVFFGSGWYVVPVVEKLINHGLELVVTNETEALPSRKSSEGRKNLIEFCKEKNIPFVVSELKDSETIHKIKDIHPTIGILGSYGAFVPKLIIENCELGIVNIHPSLLPKYKGPSPIQYALLNGETVTGVTLIKLDDQIDHGPVLVQKPYNLIGNETAEDLLSILFEIGSGMVEDVLIKLEHQGATLVGVKLENDETINETPQDHSKESWSYKIEKKDGYIDLNSPSLKIENLKLKIDRMVRAYYPWPGVWLRYHDPVIARSETTKQSSLENKIIKLLPEEKIQVEGKNPMSYKDFLNGFGEEGKNLLQKLHLL